MHCFQKVKKNTTTLSNPNERSSKQTTTVNLVHLHTTAHPLLGTSMSIKQLVCIKITKTTSEHRYESNKEQCKICLKTTLITKNKIKTTKYID